MVYYFRKYVSIKSRERTSWIWRDMGTVIMVPIITTYWRIMSVEIPAWHLVQDIPITETTCFIIGDTIAAMVVKHQQNGNEKLIFQNLILLPIITNPVRQQNLAMYHTGLPILQCETRKMILENGT